MDLLDRMLRWEQGDMDDYAEVIEFFQELIDSGMAWRLQGCYGRNAQQLIDAGHCVAR